MKTVPLHISPYRKRITFLIQKYKKGSWNAIVLAGCSKAQCFVQTRTEVAEMKWYVNAFQYVQLKSIPSASLISTMLYPGPTLTGPTSTIGGEIGHAYHGYLKKNKNQWLLKTVTLILHGSTSGDSITTPCLLHYFIWMMTCRTNDNWKRILHKIPTYKTNQPSYS